MNDRFTGSRNACVASIARSHKVVTPRIIPASGGYTVGALKLIGTL
jgi:hypothetical protein